MSVRVILHDNLEDTDAWERGRTTAHLLAGIAREAPAKSHSGVAAADGITLDAAANVGRARILLRNYITSGHVAIEGQGGDDRTYAVCCEVLNLGLSVDKAEEILRPWNDACLPPWNAEELRIKIENANTYAQNETGAWAVSPLADRIPKEVLDKLIADSEDNAPASAPRRDKFAPIFASEFRSLPKPSYVVDQLLPDKGLILLYGASGSFKSFITQDLLASTAAGIKAFNKFATVQGDTIMSAGEAPTLSRVCAVRRGR